MDNKKTPRNYTCEICDETDQHIVPEQFGAYLIGARYKEWGSAQHAVSEHELDLIAYEMNARRPHWQRYDTFQELKDKVRAVRHEGFVIWDDFDNEVKIKSPYYLATKFFGRKTPERLEQLLNDPRQAKTIIDEEYYVAIDYLAARKIEFMEMTEWERMTFLRDFFDREVLK